MKATQHGEYLWKLTQFGVINCYLVREEEGLTVIDTGMSGSGKGILAAAATIGLPITRLTVTHAHGDHVGSLDELHAALPAATVGMNRRTATFLRDKATLLPDEPQAKLRGSYVTCGTEATQLLTPGDRFGSLQVVAAPGHTPDQVAFLDTRDGTLIAGDAFQTQGGIAVAGIMRWRFPLPAMATWHLPTALVTARNLAALNPTRLAVGHGNILEAPAAAMGRAIEIAAQAVRAEAPWQNVAG